MVARNILQRDPVLMNIRYRVSQRAILVTHPDYYVGVCNDSMERVWIKDGKDKLR